MRLHVSGAGGPGTQAAIAPSTHAALRTHAPVPQVVVGTSSSTMPSQSSSTRLQSSAAAGGAGVHTAARPPAQNGAVRRQAPRPQLPSPRSSSMAWSQSSSSPLQASGAPGCTRALVSSQSSWGHAGPVP